MNACPCCEQQQKSMIGLEGHFARPRLFNWITILLLTAWVIVVGIVAESSQTRTPNQVDAPRSIVENLFR